MKLTQWIHQHVLLSILSFLGFVSAVLYITLSFIPSVKKQTSLQNWNGITPGKSTIDDVKKSLGAPLDEKVTGDTTSLSYSSQFPVYPNEVDVKNNTVHFIKEWVVYEDNKMLDDYVKTLGQPEFSVVAKDTPEAYTLYVYSTKGIAINAHTITHRVFHIWRFSPMTQDQFMQEFADLIEPNPGRAEGAQ